MSRSLLTLGDAFFLGKKILFRRCSEWAPVKSRLGWPQKISLGQGFNRSLHQEAPGSSLNSQTRMWKFTRWFQIQRHWAYLLISRLKHIKFSSNLHAVHTFPIAPVHFLVFRLLAPWIRQILEDPFFAKARNFRQFYSTLWEIWHWNISIHIRHLVRYSTPFSRQQSNIRVLNFDGFSDCHENVNGESIPSWLLMISQSS